MTTVISGNSPSSFGDEISAANLPTQGSIVGYQRGVWTPTASFGTIGAASGVWWRIGATVTVQGKVSNLSDRTSNPVHISGTPYLAFETDIGYTGSVMSSESNGAKHTAYLVPKDNVIRFYQSATTNTTQWAQTTYNNLGANNDFRFQVTYLTEDTTWTPINGATVS